MQRALGSEWLRPNTARTMTAAQVAQPPMSGGHAPTKDERPQRVATMACPGKAGTSGLDFERVWKRL